MYYGDHGAPRFPANYGGDEATVATESLDELRGRLARRALALALEWALEHRPGLRQNWELATWHEPLKAVAPLD